MMNNEQQHTPGPWRTTLNPNMERGVRTTSGFICFLPKPSHFHEQDELYKHDLITNEANAHLIAAAPELLEALKAVIRVADRKTVEFDMAHAAIAKAIGWQTAGYTTAEQNCPGYMGPCGQCEQPEINGDDIMLDQMHADAPSPYDP